jgi:hypothetical protein
MWSRLYRNYVIMPFPSYDTAANAWAPQADISWCVGPSRESAFVRFPNRFMTEGDAVACALRQGKAWIDDHLGRLHSISGSEPARTIDRIEAVKNGQEIVTAPPRSRTWHVEKTFTFGQFKSVIARSGVTLSEEILHKSYAALVKLRKNNHWSWAQTRQKVEYSQHHRGAVQAPAKRKSPARIPLTERGWRRMS